MPGRSTRQPRVNPLTLPDAAHLRSWSLLAHELRGRLSASILSAELLLKQMPQGPPGVLEELHALRLSLHETLLKLNSLVALERLRTGVLAVRPSRLSLTEVANLLRTRFRDAATVAGIELTVQGEGDVDTDRGLLELLSSSLLDNAIRHSCGTAVWCQFFASGEGASAGWGLEVVDNGVGLPASAVAVLNEPSLPGFHLEGPAGLRLVRGLADRLGLTVRVLAPPDRVEGPRLVGRGTAVRLEGRAADSSRGTGTTDNVTQEQG